jgi:hypothetical protein
MTERWCKLFKGAVTDEKIVAVAADAGVPRVLVSATWPRLLTYATEHHPDTGSIEGFDPRVWAAWCETPLELVERTLDSLRKFGLLVGNTIARWLARQRDGIAKTTGPAPAVPTPASARTSTERVRRHRSAPKQIPLLLPITTPPAANRSAHANDETLGRNVSRVSSSVSPVEKPCETNRMRETPLERELEKESESESFKTLKVVSGGRFAPLAKPPPSAGWLKRRKREALEAKLFRYTLFCLSGAAQERAQAGLMASDPAEVQRWVDRLDLEMRASGWKDEERRAYG